MKKVILFVSMISVVFIFTACSGGPQKEDLSKYATECEKTCAKNKDGCMKYSKMENQIKGCENAMDRCLNECKEKK